MHAPRTWRVSRNADGITFVIETSQTRPHDFGGNHSWNAPNHVDRPISCKIKRTQTQNRVWASKRQESASPNPVNNDWIGNCRSNKTVDHIWLEARTLGNRASNNRRRSSRERKFKKPKGHGHSVPGQLICRGLVNASNIITNKIRCSNKTITIVSAVCKAKAGQKPRNSAGTQVKNSAVSNSKVSHFGFCVWRKHKP